MVVDAPPYVSYSSMTEARIPANLWATVYSSLQALKGHVQEYPGCQSFDVFVKYLLPHFDPFTQNFYRYASSAVFLLPWLVWRFGWQLAAGFLAGATLSQLNFMWLMSSVRAVIDKILAGRNAPPAARRIVSMLVRYALVALVAYVIFKSSAQAAYGLFAGLFLPILAAMCEGAYEAMVSARGNYPRD